MVSQEPRLVHAPKERSEVDSPVDRADEVATTGGVNDVELATEGGAELHPFWGLLQAVGYKLW